MKVGIHQPAFNPWLGYFDKLRNVDLFIYLDTVQYQRGGYQNRNKVQFEGQVKWLTVPVNSSGLISNSIKIKDIVIDNSNNWRKKHLDLIKRCYIKSPQYNNYIKIYEEIYSKEWNYLTDICWEFLNVYMNILKINTKIIKASELPELDHKKSDLILEICKCVGATNYYSGIKGLDYLDQDKFNGYGIAIEFQEYIPVEYYQNSQKFIPSLGVIDYLFWDQKL